MGLSRPAFIAALFLIIALAKPNHHQCYANTEERRYVTAEEKNEVHWVIEEIWTMRTPTSNDNGHPRKTTIPERNHSDDSYDVTGERTTISPVNTTTFDIDTVLGYEDNKANAMTLFHSVTIFCTFLFAIQRYSACLID